MSADLRIKVCGLRRPEDVRAAAAAGADYLGFVLAGGPRHVEPSEARRLQESATGGTPPDPAPRPVAVLVDATAEEALEAASAASVGIVQLHGDESPETCRALREAGLEVWKALRPRSRDELGELARRYRHVADALHVEGWSARAAGGTGTSFPWAWAAALGEDGEEVPRRGRTRPHPDGAPALILAGGLTPDNVAEAVRAVRPSAVDVSSGVEVRPGVKDPERIRAFVARAREAAGATTDAGAAGETGA